MNNQEGVEFMEKPRLANEAIVSIITIIGTVASVIGIITYPTQRLIFIIALGIIALTALSAVIVSYVNRGISKINDAVKYVGGVIEKANTVLDDVVNKSNAIFSKAEQFLKESRARYYNPVADTLKEMADDPDLKLKFSNIRLEYLNPEGTVVKINKHQAIEVLKDNLKEYWDYKISVDASAKGAAIKDMKFDTDVGKIEKIQHVGGSWNVQTVFDPSYNKGDIVDRNFAYILLNSYTGEEENFVLSIYRIVDHVTVKVILPEPAQILSYSSYCSFGGYQKHLGQAGIAINGNSRTLTWTLTNPPLGHMYTLYWHRTALAKKKEDNRKLSVRMPDEKDDSAGIGKGKSRFAGIKPVTERLSPDLQKSNGAIPSGEFISENHKNDS